jgi:lipoate-protein ligase A
LDHALAACSSPGEGVLRIYRWSGPTVSFGRNEPARGRYDPAKARNAGFEFVRRPTGGRAVLHDEELTYAAVLPLAKRGLRATYALINRGLVRGLRSLGVPATMAEGDRLQAPLDSGPCFDEPSTGEVTVRGRKLVGSAQARIEGAILQHGSLLISAGQQRLLGLDPSSGELSQRESSPFPTATCLEEVLGQAPPWTDLVDAVVSGVKGVAEGDWHRGELTEAERLKSVALTEQYASAEWTWRR